MEPTNTLSRAVDNPMVANRLGQSPLISALVLGMPQAAVMPSSLILPRITVPNYTFKYPIWGKEHLRHTDTRRANRAQIMRGSFSATTGTATLERYSFADEADIDELADAIPEMNLRQRKAAFARVKVQLDIEFQAATLLGTAANYPVANRLALAGGDEWGAGGNVYDDFQTVAAAISSTTGGLLTPDMLSIFMPTLSLQAALDDSAFRAASVYGGTARGNRTKLAEYLGCKEIVTANPITASEADVISPLYSDIAIVYYAGAVPMGTIADFGELNFGATFALNGGVALEPWYDNDHTTWVFPWEDRVKHAITNSSLGGIITNCAP